MHTNHFKLSKHSEFFTGQLQKQRIPSISFSHQELHLKTVTVQRSLATSHFCLMDDNTFLSVFLTNFCKLSLHKIDTFIHKDITFKNNEKLLKREWCLMNFLNFLYDELYIQAFSYLSLIWWKGNSRLTWFVNGDSSSFFLYTARLFLTTSALSNMSRPPTMTSVTPRLRLFKDVWLLPPSIVVITNTTFCNQNDHSESRPRPTFSTRLSSGYSIKICQSFVHWRRFVDCFSKILQD